MADDFEVLVEDRELREALATMAESIQDATPLMEDIARMLRNVTEDALQAETSPFGDAWEPLKEDTIARREEAGHWPGSILQVTGGLAASISTNAGPDFAELGAAKEYAAIHQFGGLPDMAPGPAGVPQRSYLPIDQDGNIPDTLRDDLLDTVAEYLQRAAGP